MRWFAFVLMVLVSCSAYAGQGDAGDDELRHKWVDVTEKDSASFSLASSFKAPEPFSMSGEPEATMRMEAEMAPEGMTLKQIIDGEIKGIREDLIIAEYQEEDGHKPVDGIVSYIEKIDGQEVGFIKYRVAGNSNGKLPTPRSVRHMLLIKNGQIWYVHLIVTYAGHGDEVAADQMRLVKKLIHYHPKG